MSGQERGKRGTVKMDPTATIPEATPRMQFVDDPAALAEADRAILGSAPTQAVKRPAKPAQPASDRQEFAKVEVETRRAKTLELRKVDVSGADPRRMATVKGRGIAFDPSLDAVDDEQTPAPRASSLPKIAAIVCLAALAVVIGLLVWSRYLHR